MISLTDSITVHCQWMAEGYFFIWAEDSRGYLLEPQQFKRPLFAWHAASFYGTTLETQQVDHKEGVMLSSMSALDYFLTPSSLLHAQLVWSEEMEWLKRIAPLYTNMLKHGWYAPDFAKWKGGMWGWRPVFPEDYRLSYEAIMLEAQARFPYLGEWFDHLVSTRVESDDAVRMAWQQLVQVHPIMQSSISTSSRKGSAERTDEQEGMLDWHDEEEWWEAIGWKQDTGPFRIAIQLVEPGSEFESMSELELDPDRAMEIAADGMNSPDPDVWSLRLVLQDKQQEDLLMECNVQGQPLNGEFPEHWKEQLQQVIAKDQMKWIRLLPWLEDDSAPGHIVSSMTEQQAWGFLTEGSLRLLDRGFSVLLPAWWQAIKQAKPKLKAQVKSSVGSSQNSLFGLNQIIEFDWKLAIGGLDLSEVEFKQMVEQQRRLIHIRDQWIALDPALIGQVQSLMKQAQHNKGLSFRDVLEQHLIGSESHVEANASVEETSVADPRFADLRMEVELNEHLSTMMQQLHTTTTVPMIEPPAAFEGSLRQYQLEGASWLLFLRRFGLGACLADDMGLGKTIQFITYLLHLKQEGALTSPALLICPTSVLGNWQKELQRFAPDLSVHLHYGSDRGREAAFAQSIHDVDLVITSYTLAHLDQAELSSVAWNTLCLDEAQNIKNAYTKQSRAIRGLDAYHRIALTGTPIENRLTELWSIFDFINPGYFGSLREFNQKYVSEIERTQDDALIGQVQKLVRPFLLRRMKKDPAIQLALPDKVEAKCYISLTGEQGSLYENIIQDVFRKMDHLTGMERRGLILSTLVRLKQLCNHPSLMLKEGNPTKWGQRSNKLIRLVEMVREVLDEQERCLIFTQFVEMGHMLQAELQRELHTKVQFLHGGVPKAQRDRMIAYFQDNTLPEDERCNIFILSLKAGGTGLNLTEANHVFHYDRWWNPAVENQATDRAYRIGQSRNVQVHKFVTLGTLEERIDDMLERKQGLSEQIVGGGESWITELSTDDLRELFALRGEWINS